MLHLLTRFVIIQNQIHQLLDEIEGQTKEQKMTKTELNLYNELKELMLDATHPEEERYNEEKIHSILNNSVLLLFFCKPI